MRNSEGDEKKREQGGRIEAAKMGRCEAIGIRNCDPASFFW
jgi:hypothetical protein